MINPFVIPKNYFGIEPEKRKGVCNDIVKQVLEKTRERNPTQVLTYLTNILKKNEVYNVEIENYQAAQLFVDLQIALKENFGDINTEKNE